MIEECRSIEPLARKEKQVRFPQEVRKPLEKNASSCHLLGRPYFGIYDIYHNLCITTCQTIVEFLRAPIHHRTLRCLSQLCLYSSELSTSEKHPLLSSLCTYAHYNVELTIKQFFFYLLSNILISVSTNLTLSIVCFSEKSQGLNVY